MGSDEPDKTELALIVDCQNDSVFVTAESDFLLQVVVPDLRAYDRFLTGRLLKLPGECIRSNFSIHTVKAPGALPLGHLPGAEQ